ncbi:hypothetical protein JCM11641_006928 [Rhodosporidiobolus odoratus]
MMPSFPWWVGYTCYAGAMAGVGTLINSHVKEPYMDEIFHVPQAQAYCAGRWDKWDGAITTPPGPYLLPAVLSHGRHLALSYSPSLLRDWYPCALPNLRSYNLLLGLSLPFLYRSLLDIIQHSSPTQRCTSPGSMFTREKEKTGGDWEALVIALNPLVGWWAWLFYTDLGSLVLVLLAWKEALKGRWATSAVLGSLSLWFRQTNIVWLAFIAGQGAVGALKRRNPGGVYDPMLAHAPSTSLLRAPLSLLSVLLRHPLSLTPFVGAYLPVFGAAAAFVRWNGGIVLGDKQNHEPVLHVPQLYYFASFAAVLCTPVLLGGVGFEGCLRATAGLVRTPRRTLGSLVSLIATCWTIRHYTIAHPFLLADNRHYAFYLWRRVINVTPLERYALAPVYLVAGRLLSAGIAQARLATVSTAILFLLSTIAVLVPTPLLEPRYFLIPLVILRLYLSPPSSTPRRRLFLALEAASYLVMQGVCVYLFLEKTFVWDVKVGEDGKGLEGRDEREVGRVQRFMW